MDGKPHWTYVTPDYLSKAFAEVRDQVERFAAMKPRERPTFHEIRGLGSRTYREQGMSKAAIQALMTHSNERVTEIYLDGGYTGRRTVGAGRYFDAMSWVKGRN